MENNRFQNQIDATKVLQVLIDIEDTYGNPGQQIKFTHDALSRFKKLKKKRYDFIYRLKLNNVSWSDKILFGGDFPFIGPIQSIEIILALLSKKLNLNPLDLKKVLGLNALRLIKPRFNIISTPNLDITKIKSFYPDNINQLGLNSFISEMINQNMKIISYESVLKNKLIRINDEISVQPNEINENAFILTLSATDSKDKFLFLAYLTKLNQKSNLISRNIYLHR